MKIVTNSHSRTGSPTLIGSLLDTATNELLDAQKKDPTDKVSFKNANKYLQDKPMNLFMTDKLIAKFVDNVNKRFAKPVIKQAHIAFVKDLTVKLAYQIQGRAAQGMDLAHENSWTLTHCKFHYAKKLRVTKRTIQNYMKRLEAHNFIKVLNDESKLRIVLNPDLFEVNEYYDTIRIKSLSKFDPNRAANELMAVEALKNSLSHGAKNFRPIIITGSNNNNRTTDVDGIVNTVSKHDENSATEKLEAPDSVNNPEQVNGSDAPGAAATAQISRSRFVNEVVAWLVTWCVQNLYNGRQLNDMQMDYIRDFFIDDANRVQDHVLKNNWLGMHTKRLNKWKRFVARKQDRFTPVPSIFFDNTIDFVYESTKEWVKQDDTKQRRTIQRSYVKRAVRYARTLLNPQRDSKGLYKTHSLSLNQTISALDKHSKNVDRYCQKYDRLDLLGKYYAAIQTELEKNPFANW